MKRLLLLSHLVQAKFQVRPQCRFLHIKAEPNETIIPLSSFDFTKPTVGRTSAEQQALALLAPDMPENPELIRVAIIGAPNAGKSTFVNRIMGWRISSVSKKPHTTRHRITGALTDANKQITRPESSLHGEKNVAVVHDVGNSYIRFKLDEELLKCLYAHPEKEAILILNKTDTIKRKRMLLDVTTVLTDGSLNGIPYRLDSPYHRNGKLDMERLFLKTAHEMNIPLPKSEKDLMKEQLLLEMKQYEEKLLQTTLDDVNLDLTDADVKQLVQQHQENSLTLEKLQDNFENVPYKSINDISPFEFKNDLMSTDNWHLYYQKLSQIRKFTSQRSTWPYFNQVFMISAKQNHGIAAVRKYLFTRTKPAQWMFHRNFVTDQLPQEIAETCIREKMLNYLPEEIPYSYIMRNELWEMNENDVLNIVFIVYPREKRLKRDVSALLKNHGEAVKMISIEAENDLSMTFRCDVKLKLIVVREGFSVAKRIETKACAADLVTEFDQRVEEILITKLKEKFPSHKFIGEESAAGGAKQPLTDDPTWIIDPIDGTTNFVHGFPFIAISVGLVIKKQAEIGVIYNPISENLYSAVKGKGAFKNGRPIQSSQQTELGLSQVSGEYGSSRDPQILQTKSENLRKIVERAHSVRAIGSAALNLCHVAEGSCDAYFEYGIHCWDIAAGDLIAREAGCFTSDPTGDPLDIMKRQILCTATKQLAMQLIPLLTHVDFPSD
ncbi:unnamed protein product [Didymodactylos carnosus]|uniref:inositol-phosphate phosphatase n=1 Tax=Didymodactylos carnosus TaxID=1234261 RepID=A0A814FXG6_9BILA|nr:unnamed protein product [Didymodactylos carnosus]CAF0991369.1 unnamed protein product [Didymodactylos carnosus]CAF3629763.1 unnamed protein product [Didymodactylos carnosus]CAF3763300.1 unnamed protein product [Didymodactylos carnosus]